MSTRQFREQKEDFVFVSLPSDESEEYESDEHGCDDKEEGREEEEEDEGEDLIPLSSSKPRLSNSPDIVQPSSPKNQGTLIPHASFQFDNVPFRHIRVLGHGSYALVDEVECLAPSNKGRTFARKVLTVSRRQRLDEIVKELHITKSLHHFHVIEVKSTYEEIPKTKNGKKTFGIIIDPVADCTLKDYLEMLDGRTGSLQGDESINLETWFGCLASGLAFIHAQRIRHKDIKPANILLKGNRILYSDFGISKAFEDDETTTKTGGDPGKRSAMYCAPEVAAHEQRGRKLDVFSLGCVFIEILTVLCGISLQEFAEWRGPEGARAYYLNQDRILRWLFYLQPKARGYQHYCCATLIPSLSLRISATDLRQWISCDRDYFRSWHGDRACSCLGHEPAGVFSAVSLDYNPPHGWAITTAQPISWAIAYELWITKTCWNQTNRRAPPSLIRREPPARVEHSSVAPRNFLEELGIHLWVPR